MPKITIDPRVLNVAITLLPEVIDAVKRLWASRHPGEPVPTNEEVIAAFEAAYQSSLAKDDAWRAAHPTAL